MAERSSIRTSPPNRGSALIAFAVAALLATASVAAAAPQQKERPAPARQPAPGRAGPATPRPQGPALPSPAPGCPDIAVTDLKIILVSTELGQPGIEFPKDRVRLDLKVMSVGTAKPPANFAIVLYRNDERFVTLPTATTDPAGGTWLYGYPDTFPHNVKTTYKAVAFPAFSECRTDNNQVSVTADEYLLHPGATAGLDLAITQMTAENGSYTYFGDIVGAAMIHVTVRNESPRELPPREWKWTWTVDGAPGACAAADPRFHAYQPASFVLGPWESRRLDFSFDGNDRSAFTDCRTGMVVQHRIKAKVNCDGFGNESDLANNETHFQVLVTFTCRDH